MGKALNVSPIIILIFLTLMGKIWGLSGMFLSVPILVTILIFLKNFEQTKKKIAILLSEKGNIKKKILVFNLEFLSIDKINPKPIKYVSIDEPP